jgi:cation:H+ antiporter
VSLFAAVSLVVIGLALLALGGEALVRAATTLAELAGVTPAVIGLTVVAIGTSLPELVVSLVAAVRHQPDLAVANVVGSNIFNVAATLGLAALVLPLPVHGTAVRLEWPFMFAASCVFLLFSRDGTLDRLEGGFFLIALVLFVAYSVRLARREVSAAEARSFADSAEAHDIDARRGATAPPGIALPLVFLAFGVAALVVGGRFLVDGSVALARLAGVSERVIGLTIVAGGTGAPELATSLVAAFRGRTDVAVANLIGSNIFNILGILGVSALVVPLSIAPEILRSDLWWMIGTSLLLLPIMHFGGRITRWEGALLVAVYLVYLGVLLRS